MVSPLLNNVGIETILWLGGGLYSGRDVGNHLIPANDRYRDSRWCCTAWVGTAMSIGVGASVAMTGWTSSLSWG